MKKLTKDQQELATQNYFLVEKVAWKWCNKTNLTYIEAHDAVTNALMKSVTKFDPSKGYVFTTYFGKVAENQIFMKIRDKKAFVRAANDNTYSFDYVYGDDNDDSIGSLLDIIRKEDEYSFIQDDELNFLFNELQEMERLYICEYFYKHKGQKQIAKENGTSQSYVSRVIERGIKRMKKKVEVINNV